MKLRKTSRARRLPKGAGLLVAANLLLAGCAPLGPLKTALENDAWMQAIDSRAGDPRAGGDNPFRWRHPVLSADRTLDAGERLALRGALYRRDDVLAANAAIALARAGDGAGRRCLIATIRNRDLKLPMRLAAVEALASLPGRESVAALQAEIDALAASAEGAARESGLYAELLMGLARHAETAGDPRFVAALDSPTDEVRRAAVAAWRRSGADNAPDKLALLAGDPDPRVRSIVLGVLAARHHPQALDALRQGVRDASDEVRLAAAAALGELGSPPALAELRSLLASDAATMRAAATRALASAGERSLAADMAQDSQWQVRQALAISLAEHPDAEAQRLAWKLLDDPSGEVQLAVLESVSRWPVAQAGPVLLAAIDRPAYRTRRRATDLLAAKWPFAMAFVAALERSDREQSLAELKTAWEVAYGELPALAQVVSPAKSPAALSPVAIARAKRLLDDLRRGDERTVAAASRETVAMGREFAAALDFLSADITTDIPEVVYLRVLPRIEPAFAAIANLDSKSVEIRRRAALELRAAAGKAGLPGVATERIAKTAMRETDELVLTALLYAVDRDPRAGTIRLAVASLAHPAPEVRRLACELLARHGAKSESRALIAALDDSYPAVTLAAVQALGRPGMLDDTTPLERLVAAPNKKLRLEVAAALVRLGSQAGANALERLARDQEPDVRRQAAVKMGEAASPGFAATLVDLLDEGHGIGPAALAALPACAGYDLCAERGLQAADFYAKAEAWRSWHASDSRSARWQDGPMKAKR